MKENHGGANALAIGKVTIGFSVISFLFLLVFIYTDIRWYHHDFGLDKIWALVFIFIALVFYVGSIFLAVGLTLKLTYKPETESKEEPDSENDPNKIETIPTEEEKKTVEKNGKIICPHCGKEQPKNAFGCIYCHEKFD